MLNATPFISTRRITEPVDGKGLERKMSVNLPTER